MNDVLRASELPHLLPNAVSDDIARSLQLPRGFRQGSPYDRKLFCLFHAINRHMIASIHGMKNVRSLHKKALRPHAVPFCCVT